MIAVLVVDDEPLARARMRRLLAESADLDDFREALADLYPDLDGRAFAALMAQALAVADAAGRLEAGG